MLKQMASLTEWYYVSENVFHGLPHAISPKGWGIGTILTSFCI